MSGDQKHQYHLVEPSPWPAVGSAAGFTLVLGLTMFMHEYAYSVYILGAGVLMVLATMFFWWRDVVREAEYQGHHTPIVQIGMRYGMMLFISSEVMFFVAFFWAFFDSSLYPDTGVWPPADITTFDPFDLPLPSHPRHSTGWIHCQAVMPLCLFHKPLLRFVPKHEVFPMRHLGALALSDPVRSSDLQAPDPSLWT